MILTKKISRVGHSLGILLNKAIAEELGIELGDWVEVSIVKKGQPLDEQPTYTHQIPQDEVQEEEYIDEPSRYDNEPI
jgi:antitoxin component of MazEF toxin-antitoxin module